MPTTPTTFLTASGPTGWSAVSVVSEVTRVVSNWITFPTNSGITITREFSRKNCDDIGKVLSILYTYGAILPVAASEYTAFIKQLLPSADSKPLEGTAKPGFTSTGEGFVLAHTMLGDAKNSKFFLDDTNNPVTLGDTAGTLAGYRELTTLLQHTSIGTFAFLVMLASAVPRYLKLRGAGVPGAAGLISETATFNLVAASGSGKTLPLRIAAGVCGHPDDHGTWEGTRRGQEEYLSARNEVGAIFDDLEKLTDSGSNLKAAIEVINQCVPAGRSKRLSKSVGKQLPSLNWLEFGLSSSPETIDSMLKARGWKPRSKGQKVRLFDLLVGDVNIGGFIDERPAGTDPVEFGIEISTRIESLLAANHGFAMPAFLELLIKLDLSDKIVELTFFLSTRWYRVGMLTNADSR